MDVKPELLQKHMDEFMAKATEIYFGKANEIADTMALCALEEIKKIICNESLTDFEAVEEIVCVFEKYNIDCSCRHDF